MISPCIFTHFDRAGKSADDWMIQGIPYSAFEKTAFKSQWQCGSPGTAGGNYRKKAFCFATRSVNGARSTASTFALLTEIFMHLSGWHGSRKFPPITLQHANRVMHEHMKQYTFKYSTTDIVPTYKYYYLGTALSRVGTRKLACGLPLTQS